MAMAYEEERTFPSPKAAVFDAAQRAIPTIKRMRVKASDAATGRITAKKGVSMKSWGESITVEVEERGPSETNVKVGSRVRAQLVDWGVNQQNVNAVLDAIGRQLGG